MITLPICVNAIFTWKVVIQRLESYLHQSPDQENFQKYEAVFAADDGTAEQQGMKKRSQGTQSEVQDSTRAHLADAASEDLLLQVVDASFAWTPERPEDAAKLEEESSPGKQLNSTLVETPVAGGENGASNHSAFLLRNLNFAVRRGDLVAVVGSIGCGKTSLLLSLLGSMVKRKGKVQYKWKRKEDEVQATANAQPLSSHIGYVPQKPFVLSGTIRDNISMGRCDPDEQGEQASALLNEAVRKSQLVDDMERGAWNWETEIGERGTTLSGGQQQRLALARAVYGDPDLLVIDDALSAVDGHVANAIFDNVFAKRLSGQTVIIALNQLHFLPRCDYVLFVEKGQISAQGTLAELLRKDEGGSAGLRRFYSENTAEDEKDANPEIGLCSSSGPAETDAALVAEEIDFEIKATQKQDPADASAAKKKAADCSSKDGDPPSSKQDLTVTRSTKSDVFAKEMAQTGRISTAQTLRPFFNSLGRYTYLTKVVSIALCCYTAMALTDLWLADWVTSSENENDNSKYSQTERILVYVGLTLTHLCGLFALSLFNAVAMNRACKQLHNDAATTVMHARWTWFEQTPSGRILSRFGADLSAVDHFLLLFLDDSAHFFFAVTALVVVIAIVVPIVIPVLVVSLATFYLIIKRVALLSMESKRLTNQSFGPVMTMLEESGNTGREVIHSMQLQKFFQTRMAEFLSEYLRYRYFAETVTHAGFLWASLAAYAISIAAAILMLSLRNDFEPGEVGIALSYSFVLPYFFSLLVLIICYTLNMMVSLERVLELQDKEFVPQDPPWYTGAGVVVAGKNPAPVADMNQLVAAAPTGGVRQVHIEFSDVCLRYRPHLPLSLQGVNVKFLKGTKTGIIGRTGAGKSSLLVALFRLVEIECSAGVGDEKSSPSGYIKIDGIDTYSMGLQQLRRQITVIPQQTLLLEGTLANNLDPFGEHEEEELIRILEEVGLHESLSFGSDQVPELLHMRVSSKDGVSKDLGGVEKGATSSKSRLKAGSDSPSLPPASPAASTNGKEQSPVQASASASPPTSPTNRQQPRANTNRLGLSAGQQQLLAIARALLKKRPIVVMDEPTANIDNHTDRLVQGLVRRKFHDCTLITVAHRLQTIIDFDRILVMSDGRVAEDGAPWELIKNSDSHLNYMLDSYGPETAAALRRTANFAAPSYSVVEEKLK
ncbi:unnamed protein product [Amoebophrya sp. A120]|nr:unnamed protein product [Amoebophrya sp. A120]|eukprot:GSA120T00003116001.1